MNTTATIIGYEETSPLHFDLLRAPLEIRCLIYSFALPQQDVPARSPNWATELNLPNDSMNLLLANKQIYQEAHELLYSSKSFTAIFDYRSLLDSGDGYLPITCPSDRADFPPIQYVRHLQLDFTFLTDPSHRSWFSDENDYIREGARLLAESMSKNKKLETLKVKLACLCLHSERARIDENMDAIQWFLQPLRRLQISGKITVIIVLRVETDMEYDSVFHGRQQCKEPCCKKFAADILGYLEHIILNRDSLPAPLISQELRWLSLRQRAITYGEGEEWLDHAYFTVWTKMEHGTGKEFEQRLTKEEKSLAKTYKAGENLGLRGQLDHTPLYFTLDCFKCHISNLMATGVCRLLFRLSMEPPHCNGAGLLGQPNITELPQETEGSL